MSKEMTFGVEGGTCGLDLIDYIFTASRLNRPWFLSKTMKVDGLKHPVYSAKR